MISSFTLKKEEMINPWGDRVLLKLTTEEGGIIKPLDAQVNAEEGIVAVIGVDAHVPAGLKVGDRVAFRRFGGEIFKRQINEERHWDQEVFIVVNVCDIIGDVFMENKPVDLTPEEFATITTTI